MTHTRPQPLRLILAERRIPNSRLAREVGCSAHWIGRVANGYDRPSQDLAERIASTLDLPVEDLFRLETQRVVAA